MARCGARSRLENKAHYPWSDLRSERAGDPTQPLTHEVGDISWEMVCINNAGVATFRNGKVVVPS